MLATFQMIERCEKKNIHKQIPVEMCAWLKESKNGKRCMMQLIKKEGKSNIRCMMQTTKKEQT